MERYQNSTVAFVNKLSDILAQGDEVVSRGALTKELTGVSFQIINPMDRCYLLPHRNDNIFHKIAETLWVLAGRNDADWLVRYLPRALDFSDDGKTWRAAYGARLRNYGEFYDDSAELYPGVDQLKNCIRILKEDKFSRRAVMSIFDPTKDYETSKDIPCNNWIHWLIRDNALNMYVSQRSSDILWGFSGINTFEWSVLHMCMAHWLGVFPGTLTYNISSLHLYEPHFKRAQSIVDSFKGYTVYMFGAEHASGFSTSFEDLDDVLREAFASESYLRQNRDAPRSKDKFIDNCLHMLYIYNKMLDGLQDEAAQGIVTLPDNDFKLAAVYYYEHKYGMRLHDTIGMPTYMVDAYRHVFSV